MPLQNIPQTSFIPKKPILSNRPNKISTKVSVFLVISTFLFLGSLGWSGYSYFNRKLIEKNIADAEKLISKNEEDFDPILLENVSKDSDRINVIKSLLETHIDTTKIFDIISNVTLTNVRYSSFSYTHDEPTTIKVNMSGEAESYYAIAKQLDKYAESEDLKNPLMNNFAAGGDGTVGFSFTTEIPLKLLINK